MTEEESIWLKACTGLQEALDAGGDLTPLWAIRETILSGHKQFWSLGSDGNAAMVTQVEDHPFNGRECCIYLAAGDLASLERLLPKVEAWAKASGARAMTVMGRLGWQRSFLTRAAGYTPLSVLYMKELPE